MQSPRHHTSSSSNIRAAVSVSVWSSSSQLSVVGTSKQAIHSSGLPDSRIARRAPTASARHPPRADGISAATCAAWQWRATHRGAWWLLWRLYFGGTRAVPFSTALLRCFHLWLLHIGRFWGFLSKKYLRPISILGTKIEKK